MQILLLSTGGGDLPRSSSSHFLSPSLRHHFPQIRTSEVCRPIYDTEAEGKRNSQKKKKRKRNRKKELRACVLPQKLHQRIQSISKKPHHEYLLNGTRETKVKKNAVTLLPQIPLLPCIDFVAGICWLSFPVHRRNPLNSNRGVIRQLFPHHRFRPTP